MCSLAPHTVPGNSVHTCMIGQFTHVHMKSCSSCIWARNQVGDLQCICSIVPLKLQPAPKKDTQIAENTQITSISDCPFRLRTTGESSNVPTRLRMAYLRLQQKCLYTVCHKNVVRSGSFSRNESTSLFTEGSNRMLSNVHTRGVYQSHCRVRGTIPACTAIGDQSQEIKAELQ